MRNPTFAVMLATALTVAAPAAAETHRQVQAVDAAGYATYFKVGAIPTPDNLVTLEGIVLNNPEDMLDPAYNAPGWMGAQWQIFVQGEGDDHAGTAVWIGQKYSRMGDIDYTAEEWAAEMQRLNYPAGHHLRMGDRVRVTGYALGYNGKTNINERHSSSPMLDFHVEYLGDSPGLPEPEVITLADVKDAANLDIFDPTRLTGGEYYQARLVRINDVQILSGTWGPGQTLTVTDTTGRTLPVVLGRNPAFAQPSNLQATFDVVGIFNQEGAYTSGYRLWVMGYDGSADLLGFAELKAGDINRDGYVNAIDLLTLASAFPSASGDPRYNEACDLNNDGAVNAIDLLMLAHDWPRTGS